MRIFLSLSTLFSSLSSHSNRAIHFRLRTPPPSPKASLCVCPLEWCLCLFPFPSLFTRTLYRNLFLRIELKIRGTREVEQMNLVYDKRRVEEQCISLLV